MHGDKLGAVRKRGFPPEYLDHFGNARHHLGAGQDLGAGPASNPPRCGRRAPSTMKSEMMAMASGWVELDAALQPPPRHHRRH